MTCALVTFLGRTSNHQDGYPKVRYQFDDGTECAHSLLALALAERTAVDRLVVFGTSGSMWSHLLEESLPGGLDTSGPGWELYVELQDAEKNEAVDQNMIDRLAGMISERGGRANRLVRLDEPTDVSMQIDVIGELASAVADVDELDLDVTHGFRSMPMLFLLAAVYLRTAQPHLDVRHIWYGALREGGERAFVQDLSGLLEILRWTDALQRLDLLGDYGAVSGLLGDAELEQRLSKAYFLEATHQGRVANELRPVRSRLQTRELKPASRLFRDVLLERTSWVDGGQVEHQAQRARAALDRGDLLRAALYGWEAYVSRITAQIYSDMRVEVVANKSNRKGALDEINKQITGPNTSGGLRTKHIRRLKDIRDNLAHGEYERGAFGKEFESRESLARALREAFDALFRDGDT